MINHLFKKQIEKIFLTVVVLFLLVNLGFLDSASALIITLPDENVTVTAQVGNVVVTPNPPSTSGGVVLPVTSVKFSGLAYPEADVFVLKQGVLAAKVKATNTGAFSATLVEEYDSTVVYTLYAVDILGNQSLLINYPIVIYTGYLTHLSEIRFAPTITTDKAEVKEGDYLQVSGYGLPNENLKVFITGAIDAEFSLVSSSNGTYKIIIPMQGLPRGEYAVSISYSQDGRGSKLIKFSIGSSNIYNTDTTLSIPGDCNADEVINLVDFSILAFWYGKPNPPKCVDTNNDNKIDLVDFSILAFWWTG